MEGFMNKKETSQLKAKFLFEILDGLINFLSDHTGYGIENIYKDMKRVIDTPRNTSLSVEEAFDYFRKHGRFESLFLTVILASRYIDIDKDSFIDAMGDFMTRHGDIEGDEIDQNEIINKKIMDDSKKLEKRIKIKNFIPKIKEKKKI